MEPSVAADELNEVSVLVNVAHRLLLAIREDVESSPGLQGIVEHLDAAHDQLDAALDRLGAAIDGADAEAGAQPREQRQTIH